MIYHLIGTDTSCGKTYTASQLTTYLHKINIPVLAIKPLASGVLKNENINEDVRQLQNTNPPQFKHAEINFCTLKEACAPHIAAYLEDKTLSLETTAQFIHNAQKLASNVLCEGIGGLMVPLNEQENYLDLLIKLQQPIILVIGMKLGCLNHALLTAQVINQAQLPLCGFIANRIDPEFDYYSQNLHYLEQALTVPLLGTIDYQQSFQPTKAFMELITCP